LNLFREFGLAHAADIGHELHGFVEQLFPICRSITGAGVRQTLSSIQKHIALEITEVPTGTAVFDWTIPKEWNIRDAYIKGPGPDRVVDFRHSNLHVMSYSVPVHATMTLEELKPHLFTIPDKPDWIPYRTSYYQENWGFCLAHNQMLALPDGEYEVSIDSTLEDGHLTYGECYLPGRSSEEVLFSCHICHPSLANDNLSSVAVATFLARFLSTQELHYSYRFLFAPGTIGAITWLAQNRAKAHLVRHGLVLAGIGDSGGFHYKKSRGGNSEVDRAAAHVLRHSGESSEVIEYSPTGYDERQYCSPGFDLPVGCLMRSVWGTFPEYHTSADNLDFVSAAGLAGSFRVCLGIVDVLENNQRYCNQNPYCEPQLGRRNLYGQIGGEPIGDQISARLWVLNLSDGSHSLLDIADRSGLKFTSVRDAADLLCEAGLLVPVGGEEPQRQAIS
jgi:aminopeptidase-like protein